MERREVRRLADAFISEQLLVEMSHAIVAHLEQCSSCRAEIDGQRRLRTTTHSPRRGDHLNCAMTCNLAERPIALAEAVRYDAVNEAFQSVAPEKTALPDGALEIIDRHSCVYEGRRFTHLVMLYKGETVSLLVASELAQV